MFTVIAWLAILGGMAAGAVAGWRTGWGDAAWGALRGAGVGLGAYVLVMLALFGSVWLFLQYRPMFPACRAGKCRDKDYRYVYLDEAAPPQHQQLQEEHEGKFVRCRCGALYLDCPRERRFYELGEDGTLKAFMRFQPLGRWQPDA